MVATPWANEIRTWSEIVGTWSDNTAVVRSFKKKKRIDPQELKDMFLRNAPANMRMSQIEQEERQKNILRQQKRILKLKEDEALKTILTMLFDED